MSQLRSDPPLHYKINNAKLSGLSGTYVDDLLRAGDTSFQKLSLLTHKSFDMKDAFTLPTDFSGFRLFYDPENMLTQTQKHYLPKLEQLDNNATFTEFRSMRMKLAWLSHTRPDCLFQISSLAQITEQLFLSTPSTFIQQLNKASTYATKYKLDITFPNLDINSLRLIGYSDASFANNLDLSSQLGYIILLTDGTSNIIPLMFKSYKAKRLCRSAMAAEVIAFSDLFDSAFTLLSELRLLTGTPLELDLLTDSKCLFDIISKGSRTSEKRLMLDVAAARKGFETKDISNIGLVPSAYNIADGLTKPMQQAAIRNLLETHSHVPSPTQWIIRHTHDL